jgi:hypothetical protein
MIKIFMTFVLINMFQPVHAQVDLSSFTIKGSGYLTFYGMKVYKATLYVKDNLELYSSELVLKLDYNISLKGKSIGKRTIDELKKIGVAKDIAESQRDFYTRIFPDVEKGTSILASFNPSSGLFFWLNNKDLIAQVEDISKAKQFLDIWLSPKSSESKLRNSLVGLKE